MAALVFSFHFRSRSSIGVQVMGRSFVLAAMVERSRECQVILTFAGTDREI